MSWGAYSDWKCCLTCANWQGPRQRGMASNYAETYEPGTNGRCCYDNYNASTEGNCACANTTCDKWECWGPIRR